MSATKAVFVLIHGGWHNHSSWDRVTPILKANGFAALTLDLPGAGVNAIAPTSLGLHPFDPAAFAAERSHIAGVTQQERTQAVVALVKEAASLSDGKVILVGHSAGGITISAVAEQVPNLLLAVVYLSGFMVPNGMPLLAMLQHETLSSALAPRAVRGRSRRHRRDKDQWRINRRILQIATQSCVLWRPVGVRIRACGVATSLRRIERRRLSPIGNYAWKIWHGAAPLHPLHTGSRDSVDRSGSHDCDG